MYASVPAVHGELWDPEESTLSNPPLTTTWVGLGTEEVVTVDTAEMVVVDISVTTGDNISVMTVVVAVLRVDVSTAVVVESS